MMFVHLNFIDNEYIKTGYRVYYSYVDNWRSLFMLHNETGNIWTHLIGFFMFIGLMVYAHVYVAHICWISVENDVTFLLSLQILLFVWLLIILKLI
jgi:predicted membrane channel-forming protein YqfA (hemolysin III family)